MGNGDPDTRDDPHKQGRRRTFAPWTDPTARALVRFDGVRKQFSAVAAVERVSLDIFAGEFFALLGPSGCGKTTLLRLLAGLDMPDEGRILLDGEDIALVPPYRRPINMMFQNYALFPHLTVEGNVAFGLKQEGLAKSEITTRVEEMLALVRLEGLAKRKPHQLSGGQRQRVAIARALSNRPEIIVADEPTGALDTASTEQVFGILRDIADSGRTVIVVTHDAALAARADRRVHIVDGKIAETSAGHALTSEATALINA